jgi:hypothetical protein
MKKMTATASDDMTTVWSQKTIWRERDPFKRNIPSNLLKKIENLARTHRIIAAGFDRIFVFLGQELSIESH